MEKIQITKDELMDILKEYDLDNYESTPLNVLSFVDYIFHLYCRERLNPEDEKVIAFCGINRGTKYFNKKAEIFVCDSPNTTDK